MRLWQALGVGGIGGGALGFLGIAFGGIGGGVIGLLLAAVFGILWGTFVASRIRP